MCVCVFLLSIFFFFLVVDVVLGFFRYNPLCLYLSLFGENVPVVAKGDFGRMFLPDMMSAPKPCW